MRQIQLILNHNRKEQALGLLENNLQQSLNFQSLSNVSKVWQYKLSPTMVSFFCTLEKYSIAKMLAPMLDQLNLKLTASNAQAWTIDAYYKKKKPNRHFLVK